MPDDEEVIREDDATGLALVLARYDYADNPREEYDHAGTMVCAHHRYNLGDVPNLHDGWDMLREMAGALPGDPSCQTCGREIEEANRDDWRHCWEGGTDDEWSAADDDHDAMPDLRELVYLPLYLMDHSGLSMSTGSYGDPWDSGQVGYIYMTADKAREDWPADDDARRAALKCLESEVREYSAYLEDDVWSWEVRDADGETVDSCSGYYGREHVETEAVSYFEHYVARVTADRAKASPLVHATIAAWADDADDAGEA